VGRLSVRSPEHPLLGSPWNVPCRHTVLNLAHRTAARAKRPAGAGETVRRSVSFFPPTTVSDGSGDPFAACSNRPMGIWN
jgi:hypothetical protein